MATLPNPLPRLATDPSGRSLGLELPLGRLIDTTDEGRWHEPLLWHAAYSASPGAWTALGTPAGRAGLLPVLVDVGGSQGSPDEWELMPGEMSYPGDHDPEDVLAELWEEGADTYGESVTAPFDPEWPGTAPAATPFPIAPDTRAAETADALLADGSSMKDPRLALVPARRSADIPAALGWTGPLNYENDVARLCAVLRSWEDRFGARVIALTFDTLTLSVAAPPTTHEEAEAIAAEHFAFCPDNITQGPGTLTTYAKSLITSPTWTFWWD